MKWLKVNRPPYWFLGNLTLTITLSIVRNLFSLMRLSKIYNWTRPLNNFLRLWAEFDQVEPTAEKSGPRFFPFMFYPWKKEKKTFTPAKTKICSRCKNCGWVKVSVYDSKEAIQPPNSLENEKLRLCSRK